MQRVAVELKLDPLDVIRRNLVPTGAFPFRTATGGLLDSGDYPACVAQAVEDGGLAELRARQKQARAEGRLYGIGLTAVVEPSVSNMGYITTVLTPEERRKAGPKNGAQATATIALDPGGAVSVHVASVPQGQGHRTVVSQIVADALGPQAVRHPRRSPTWIPRATPGRSRRATMRAASRRRSCGAVQLAAERLKDKLARAAAGAAQRAGRRDRVRAAAACARRAIPTTRCRSGALAAAAHWAPGTLAGRGSGDPRDRVLDAAATHRADRGRRHQLLALPRLHLRFLRRGGRSRHRRGAHRQIRHHARLRPRAASRHGGRAGDRRLRARARRGAVRGIRLCRRRQLHLRHASPTI